MFHPVGVLAEGTLERLAPPGEGLPMAFGDVLGRVSKGVGVPGALPDIAGMAWRMRSQRPAATRWDVLLASSLGGGVWWLRAKLTTPIGATGPGLDTIRDRIRSTGLEFEIEQAAGTGTFLRLARLTLRQVVPDRDDVAFDPVLHSPPDVQMLPHWLTGFRRAAYQRSREGLDAE